MRHILIILIFGLLLVATGATYQAWTATVEDHSCSYSTSAYRRFNVETLWEGQKEFSDAALGRMVREQMEEGHEIHLLPRNPVGAVWINAKCGK
jgi:hypothetical protein